jgi:hypothetical protein
MDFGERARDQNEPTFYFRQQPLSENDGCEFGQLQTLLRQIVQCTLSGDKSVPTGSDKRLSFSETSVYLSLVSVSDQMRPGLQRPLPFQGGRHVLCPDDSAIPAGGRRRDRTG